MLRAGVSGYGQANSVSQALGRNEIGVEVYWRSAGMLSALSTKTWSNASSMRSSCAWCGKRSGQPSSR